MAYNRAKNQDDEVVVMDDRETTCCFSGHRSLPPETMAFVRQRTERAIRDLYSQGYKSFITGGALGYDTMVAVLLFQIRTEIPEIRVVLAYPYEGYNGSWTLQQWQEYRDRLLRYDEVVCVSEAPSKYAYWARDRYMVDRSSLCVGFCIDSASETGYTMEYARQKGVCVINLVENS